MTEKRFTSERTDDYNFSDIIDNNGKWIGICHIDSADDFVKKFNELLDALNQRTEQCDKYYKENEQLKHDATVLIYSNQEYRKENEQLKSERDYYKELCESEGLLYD